MVSGSTASNGENVADVKHEALAWISSLSRFGADLLFPPQCISCKRIGALFCPQCAQMVQRVPATICQQCGRIRPHVVDFCADCVATPAFPLVMVRAAALYTEPMSSAIQNFKYNRRKELALPLSRYMVAVFQQSPWRELKRSIDSCLPVPIHERRQSERGYNQSALLASAFAAQVGLSLREDLVVRSRETQSQTRLSAGERRHNVEDAFTASPKVAGKHLLLIDDVLTTGATLAACATALKNAGATVVYGLVLSTPRSA
jgi:ComF family protein